MEENQRFYYISKLNSDVYNKKKKIRFNLD